MGDVYYSVCEAIGAGLSEGISPEKMQCILGMMIDAVAREFEAGNLCTPRQLAAGNLRAMRVSSLPNPPSRKPRLRLIR